MWYSRYMMKTYKVKFSVEHESYNGYTHNDGWRSVVVEARNSDSAIKKATKVFHKRFGYAYDIRNTCVRPIEKLVEISCNPLSRSVGACELKHQFAQHEIRHMCHALHGRVN